MNKFNKTKVTIEFEFSHQFGFTDGIGAILSLLNVPAIKNVKVLKAKPIEEDEEYE